MKTVFQYLATVFLIGITLVNATPVPQDSGDGPSPTEVLQQLCKALPQLCPTTSGAPLPPVPSPPAASTLKRQDICSSNPSSSLCQLSQCQAKPGTCTPAELQSLSASAYAASCKGAAASSATCQELEACATDETECTA